MPNAPRGLLWGVMRYGKLVEIGGIEIDREQRRKAISAHVSKQMEFKWLLKSLHRRKSRARAKGTPTPF